MNPSSSRFMNAILRRLDASFHSELLRALTTRKKEDSTRSCSEGPSPFPPPRWELSEQLDVLEVLCCCLADRVVSTKLQSQAHLRHMYPPSSQTDNHSQLTSSPTTSAQAPHHRSSCVPLNVFTESTNRVTAGPSSTQYFNSQRWPGRPPSSPRLHPRPLRLLLSTTSATMKRANTIPSPMRVRARV